MPSLTVPAPRVNPIRPARRERKPLLPVSVRAHFVGGATRQDVIDGSAALSIVAGDATDSDESAYWLAAIYDGERCVAFRLQGLRELLERRRARRQQSTRPVISLE